MKRLLKCLLLGLLGSMNLGGFNSWADLEVSASVQVHAVADFYAPLTPCGTWIEVGTYGRCWHPAGVAVEWRPYCYGHWVWTDCGWYWASDEPWAWACYHYGSWVFEADYGWIWVPGIEWAPAWVSWRIGGGYCGWAPLAPHGLGVAPRSFVFVEVAHFNDPVRPSTLIINNTTVINRTTVIGSAKSETRVLGGSTPQRVVVNQGPGVDLVRKATGKPVKVLPIREAVGQTSVPSAATRALNREWRRNENPAPKRDLTGPLGESKVKQREPLAPRPAPTPRGRDTEPHRNGFGSAPHGPPLPNTPDERSFRPGKGRDRADAKSGGKGEH